MTAGPIVDRRSGGTRARRCCSTPSTQPCAEAYDRRAPNLIADHAHRLAQTFSKFYAACPVLAAATAGHCAARDSNLATSYASRQLELAVDVLGVAIPERM